MFLAILYLLICTILVMFGVLVALRILNPNISQFIKNETLKTYTYDRYWFYNNKHKINKKSLFLVIGQNSSKIYLDLLQSKHIKDEHFEDSFYESNTPYKIINLNDSIFLFFNDDVINQKGENGTDLSLRLKFNLHYILKYRKTELIDGVIIFPHESTFLDKNQSKDKINYESFYYSKIIKHICKKINAKIPVIFVDDENKITLPPFEGLSQYEEDNLDYKFGFFHKTKEKCEKLNKEIHGQINNCIQSFEGLLQNYLQVFENDNQNQIKIIQFFYKLKVSMLSFSNNYSDSFYRNFENSETEYINYHFVLNASVFGNHNEEGIYNLFNFLSNNLLSNADFSDKSIKYTVKLNYAFAGLSLLSAGFIVFALINSHEKFLNKSKVYIQSYQLLDNFISTSSSKMLKQPEDFDNLKNETCRLLESANNLEKTQLFCSFNFPSWYSKFSENLTQNFENKFANSFSSFILKRFNAKVNDYLSDSIQLFSDSESNTSILNKINQFFTDNTSITKIYMLLLSNDPAKVSEGLSFAADYLYGIDCFLDKTDKNLFSSIDKNFINKEINLSFNDFKTHSQNKARIYIHTYLKTIINENKIFVLSNLLNNTLLSLKNTEDIDTINFGKTLSKNILELQDSLSKEQGDFQNLNKFFSKNFYNMYKEIEENPTFGKEFFNDINVFAEEEFSKIKSNLLNLKPIDSNFPIIINNDNILTVNPALFTLGDSFAKMLDAFNTEKFAGSNKSFASNLSSISANLPKNSAWSIDALQTITQKGNQFVQATGQINLLQLPSQIQSIVKKFSVKLGEHFWSQKLPSTLELYSEKQSKDFDYTANPIDPYVQNIQESAPLLKTVSNQLLQFNLQEINKNLSHIFAQQIRNKLYYYNDSLNSSTYFNTIYPDFEWWDGNTSPVYKAFGVTSDEDFKLHISQQKDALKAYFNKNILPLLQSYNLYFQNSKQLNTNDVVINNLVYLQNNLDSTARGTSFQNLQTFLINNLLPLRTSTCSTFISQDLDSLNRSDFFSARQNSIYHSVSERCQMLLLKQALTNYDHFVDIFNSAIAGKFPFGKKPLDVASVEDLNYVFSNFQQFKAQDWPVLQKYSTTYKNRPDIQKFLKHMNALENFFALQKNKDGSITPAPLQVQIQFRTNTDKEILGNQIVDWSFQFGNKVIGSTQGNIEKGVINWNYSDPIRFEVTLAKSTIYRFQQYSMDKNLFVSNNTAFITIKNRWSLFKFILDYADCKKDLYCSKNDLMFEIPLKDNKKILFYISLNLINKNGQRMNLPKFPSSAPSLNRNNKSTLDI